MRLKSLSFSEFVGKPREWILNESEFGNINLIVGPNSTGKTRLLNVILGLSIILQGKRPQLFESGAYDVVFECHSKEYEYKMALENYSVKHEIFTIDGKTVLERDKTGKGTIEAVGIKSQLPIHMPSNRLAAVDRRDEIQHPFFEELYQWASSTKHYLFGSEFGRDKFIAGSNLSDALGINDQATKPDYPLAVFREGLLKYKNKFEERILKDMKYLGYPCESISVRNLSDHLINKADVSGLAIQEVGLKGPTTQMDMSQGMFRALALVIQLAFSTFEKKPLCILVDDIGEGLDFERSSSIINLLVETAKKHKYQLFMTTNDRFVMNSVPLEYWSVLNRKKNRVHVINAKNNEKIFDEFKYIGLNNFDFFSSGYYLGKK